MNTSRQVLFPTAALDLWSAPHAVARLLARLVGGSREASLTVEPTVLHLDKGTTVWMTRPLGRRITCDTGVLWLCFDGEPEDIVLEPGQTHCCEKTSPLSIHALSAGVVRTA